jgi:hypothetical protein
LGGSFDGFLNEEGVFGAVQTTAVKRVLAMKLSEAIEKYNLTKVEMAGDGSGATRPSVRLSQQGLS